MKSRANYGSLTTASCCRADIAKHQFSVSLAIPFLYFEAEYDVNARILSVPIKGKGTLFANASKCYGYL